MKKVYSKLPNVWMYKEVKAALIKEFCNKTTLKLMKVAFMTIKINCNKDLIKFTK